MKSLFIDALKSLPGNKDFMNCAHYFIILEVNLVVTIFRESRINIETMSGDHTTKSLYTIKFGKGLIDHPQSVRRRGHHVLKTIVGGSK